MKIIGLVVVSSLDEFYIAGVLPAIKRRRPEGGATDCLHAIISRLSRTPMR